MRVDVGESSNAPRKLGKLNVFISYSRKDSAVAQELVSDLTARGFEAYLDKKDIAPGEPWQERLGALIAAADTILFLITPDSMVSPICTWEVEEAERLAKRIMPVVCKAPPDELVPPRIRRLNWVLMTANHDRTAAIENIVMGLKVDIEWVREHTRMTGLAKRWEDQHHPESQHLRGAELQRVNEWLIKRPVGAPEVSPVIQRFLLASTQGENRRLETEKTFQRRKKVLWRSYAYVLVPFQILFLLVCSSVAIVGIAIAIDFEQNASAIYFAAKADKAGAEGQCSGAYRFIAAGLLGSSAGLPQIGLFQTPPDELLSSINRLRSFCPALVPPIPVNSEQLRQVICSSQLIDRAAQSFAIDELEDAIFRYRDDLKKPCIQYSDFSPEPYLMTMRRFTAAMRRFVARKL